MASWGAYCVPTEMGLQGLMFPPPVEGPESVLGPSPARGSGMVGGGWISPPKLSAFSLPSSQHRDSTLADVEGPRIRCPGTSSFSWEGFGVARLRVRGDITAARENSARSGGSCGVGQASPTGRTDAICVGMITAPCRAWCCPEKGKWYSVGPQELAVSIVPVLLY